MGKNNLKNKKLSTEDFMENFKERHKSIATSDEEDNDSINNVLNLLSDDEQDGSEADTDKKVKIKKEKEFTVSYYELFKYATWLDGFCMFIGVVCTIVIGILQPWFMVCFGEATGSFVRYVTYNTENITDEMKKNLTDAFYDEIDSFAYKGVGMGIVTLVLQYIAGVLFTYSSLRQTFKIRTIFLKKTLYQDIEWFDVNQTGDFATTFVENLLKIEEGIGEKITIFLFFQTIFVTGIIWALILGWKLSLVCMISLPLSTILMGLISWVSTKFSKQESESYAAAGSIAEEVFSAIRTVISFEGQKKECKRYEKHLVEARNNNVKRSLFNGVSNAFMWFFVYGSCAISFWYGVSLIIDERVLPLSEQVYSPERVIAIFFNTLMAFWNFNMGAPYIQIFGSACGAAAKVFKVLKSEPKINKSLKSGLKLKNMKGEIRFENVFFRYPSRPEVKILNGLTLNINPGETVAIVGSSGCGKSTCIQLLQRFYDPSSGEILIDNCDIKDLNLSWLRSKIGVVGQEPILFATTIAENIRYGKLSVNQEDIEKAAKKAQVHKFIKNLPNGYDTIIGERGTQLSGGQKQKIAIARALVRKPYILLLDEATSALDTASEVDVQAAIDSVSQECTTIIVAHRLSTIRNAQKIVVLDKGRVVEQGTHQDLLAEQGVYYNLVNSQVLNTVNKESVIEANEVNEKVFEGYYDRRESIVNVHKFKHRDSITNTVKPNITNDLWNTLKMNSPEWVWILLGCLSSLVIGASLPIYSIIFGDTVGSLAISDDDKLRDETKILCIYFVILGIASGLAYLVQMYSFGVAGENLTLRVRSTIFETMLKQEIGWFDKKENGVGALCSRLSSDAAAIQGASGMPIGTVINSLSTIILANAFAIYFQWKLALLLLSFFPFIFISIYFEQKIVQGNSDFTQKMLQKSASIAVEAIGNIKTVVALCCEEVFAERYNEELLPYIISSQRRAHFRAFIMGMAKSMMLFAYSAGLNYGAKLIVDDGIEYGIVFKVCELVIVGSWALGNTFAFAPNFQSGINAASRMFALLKREPKVKNIKNASKKKWEKGDIEYSNTYFSYPTRPNLPVLKGLDLNVMAGKTVALVGSSGCGKSTIIQLLERFYNPTAGEVCIDDVDIKIIDLQHIRSNLGIVSQEPNLFDRTIAENIAYGNNQRAVSMKEIIQAAKDANIHKFITSLPLGYETRLGSKGTQLSGGQKQRIAIARALVRNPKILLLDEATSALDNESEKIVQEALDKAKQNRTCITIAHRLTTIQDADLICVLDKGRLVEQGTHQELINKRQHYYNFCIMQNGTN